METRLRRSGKQIGSPLVPGPEGQDGRRRRIDPLRELGPHDLVRMDRAIPGVDRLVRNVRTEAGEGAAQVVVRDPPCAPEVPVLAAGKESGPADHGLRLSDGTVEG